MWIAGVTFGALVVAIIVYFGKPTPGTWDLPWRRARKAGYDEGWKIGRDTGWQDGYVTTAEDFATKIATSDDHTFYEWIAALQTNHAAFIAKRSTTDDDRLHSWQGEARTR